MFSIIAIGLGTMGIWISYFPGGYSSSTGIDKLSIFTFCIATLGSMAVEYFFEERDKISNDSKNEIKDTLSLHLVFFLWSLSALLSFYALNTSSNSFIGLISTLTLWLFVNIHRPKFQSINKDAIADLDPDYEKNDSTEAEIGGAGL